MKLAARACQPSRAPWDQALAMSARVVDAAGVAGYYSGPRFQGSGLSWTLS